MIYAGASAQARLERARANLQQRQFFRVYLAPPPPWDEGASHYTDVLALSSREAREIVQTHITLTAPALRIGAILASPFVGTLAYASTRNPVIHAVYPGEKGYA